MELVVGQTMCFAMKVYRAQYCIRSYRCVKSDFDLSAAQYSSGGQFCKMQFLVS